MIEKSMNFLTMLKKTSDDDYLACSRVSLYIGITKKLKQPKNQTLFFPSLLFL